MTIKIGYILCQFPVTSQTFVINEIIVLQSLDIEVYPVSMFPPNSLKKLWCLRSIKKPMTFQK